MMRLLLALLCAFSLATASAVAGAANTLSSFSAEYRIRHGSLTVGKAVFTLKVLPDGRYTYAAHSEATGITALFFNDTVSESSAGTLPNNTPLPYHYVYQRSGKKSKAKTESIRFEWTKKQLLDLDTGKPWKIPLPPQTLDRQTVQLQLMLDLREATKNYSYTIADDHAFKTWNFQLKGKDTINTPAGQYQALIVKRNHRSKKRATEMWCAPSLGNLPVMIEHQKNGDTEFYMELVKISGKPVITTP
jgi:hypothetical protein